MRTIRKTISLEPVTSRLPGILPAYKDNVLYYFDDESLKEREYEFPSNYGMVPVNIMLDNAPSADTDTWNFSYNAHCYGQTLGTNEECYDEPFYDEFPNFTLSWERLSDWYKFFTDYYHLLNDWGHCSLSYSSATHYYVSESKNGHSDQLVYGDDEELYAEIDRLFKERGGKVKIIECEEIGGKCNFDKCSAHTVIHESVDDGFYKWICENIIPTFVIPSAYKDYWATDKLYYPDVVKWIGWLNDRIGYGTHGSMFECSASTDCCECEEWWKRGGEDILSSMTEWFESVQDRILKNIDSVDCAIPTMIMPVNMQVSIDNLGEFSIFSTDYELGIDYRCIMSESSSTHTEIQYNENNSNTGTVVSMGEKTMILTSGTGFAYDDTYMEKYVSECQDCHRKGTFTDRCPRCGSKNIDIIGWSDYNPDNEQVACSFEEYDYAYREPNSGYTTDGRRVTYNQGDEFYFTFDENDKRVVADTDEELRRELAIEYPIEEYDSVMIEGSLYDVQSAEYGEYSGSSRYLNGRIFYVFREDYTDTPYTLINGKKIYADFYPYGDVCNQFYYFPFFRETNPENDSTCSGSTLSPEAYKKFPRTRTTVTDYKYFVTYNGSQHEVEESGLTINGTDYPRISGICNTQDEMLYIKRGDSENVYHIDSEMFRETEEYELIADEFKIRKKIDNNIKVYVGGVISGDTISKLYDLRSNALLTDDIGNTIEALYDVGEHYNHQPPEGTRLEPIYQVGNVANVNRFSMSVERLEDLSDQINYFVGDIITSMKFYYRDTEGNEVPETSVYAETPTGGEMTSLAAIDEATEIRNSITDYEFIFDDDIYCDITYYIGATLQRSSSDETGIGTTPFKLAENTDDYTFSSGVCYTETVRFVETEVQYYLKPENNRQIPMTKNSASAHTVSYPVTCYIMEQNEELIESDYDNNYFCSLAHFSMPLKTDTNDFELYNGTRVFPVFREEYMMGMACMQNVDSDIYIDRGINTAFEKHLKLGEVTSIESLEQYGNRFFKIIEN